MKLIVRGADYAMTDSITDGCLRAARCGILTDVGLMTNNAAQARYAVNELKKYPHVSVGQDLNLVSGLPASDPKDIPALVDENGIFISSTRRKLENLYEIPYDQIYREMKQQVENFIEIVGRKPCYFAGHSLSTPEVEQAMVDIAEEYGVLLNCFGLKDLPVGTRWYYKNMRSTRMTASHLTVWLNRVQRMSSGIFFLAAVSSTSMHRMRCLQPTAVTAMVNCKTCRLFPSSAAENSKRSARRRSRNGSRQTALS